MGIDTSAESAIRRQFADYMKEQMKNEKFFRPEDFYQEFLAQPESVHAPDVIIDDVLGPEQCHGMTLGSLIRSLRIVANVVGENVEVFVRTDEGIHSPMVCVENTPNELPVDKIVTIQ